MGKITEIKGKKFEDIFKEIEELASIDLNGEIIIEGKKIETSPEFKEKLKKAIHKLNELSST